MILLWNSSHCFIRKSTLIDLQL